ncbi:hypothetical protein BJ875DRAFT_490021 [Amylocarpus encephaloides]|uniref:Uncharacterized protein n=1 Tax=Amylocarpus encephaloides TaxID=45428 RepID=A0A9P7Y8A1_9HELO|nr:hypothetical protein BJ875DRAFT_490021 [Amylocarpus encephaloides]
MAQLMAPPPLPGGYSLRVQLFSHAVLNTSDRPIRSFRVSTSPEATVREFCAEASRIHELSYGTPISIKKCQDDQEFDVTQTDVLGNLFANMAVIRFIQASPLSNIRDSVPPTSALRFNASNMPQKVAGLKRIREGSASQNTSPQGPSKLNKRQRVLEPGPDTPIKSRETEHTSESRFHVNRNHNFTLVPNSQESVDLDNVDLDDVATRYTTPQNVRLDPFEVPESPSPCASPILHGTSSYAKDSTDDEDAKAQTPRSNRVTKPSPKNTMGTTPVVEIPVKSPFNTPNSQRAKNASRHVQRATERGASVSTPAASPTSCQSLSTNKRITNGLRKSLDATPPAPVSSRSLRRNSHNSPQNVEEEDIYDQVPSENDDAAAIIALKRATAKLRKTKIPVKPGLNHANGNFNIPTNGNRRPSASRAQCSTGSPGELPLTPSSIKRQQEANDAKQAREAATQAAEKRKREAEEKEAEEARILEEEILEREEQARLEAEELRRKEVERQAALEATRLQQEEEERKETESQEVERQEAERQVKERNLKEQQAKRLKEQEAKEAKKEEAWLLKNEKARERSLKAKEKQAAAKEAVDRLKGERVEYERWKAPESTRLDVEHNPEGDQLQQEGIAKDQTQPSSSHKVEIPQDQARHSSSTTPVPTKQQSSTPFIPTGRKSALRSVSASRLSGSPLIRSESPSVQSHSLGIGIDAQKPLLREKSRKISFAESIKPRASILPPTLPSGAFLSQKATAPKSVNSQSLADEPTLATKTSEPLNKIPVATLNSPILPPPRIYQRSITPMNLSKSSQAILPPTVGPRAQALSRSASRSSIVPSSVTKKPIQIDSISTSNSALESTMKRAVVISSDESEESDSGSDSDSAPEPQLNYPDKIAPVNEAAKTPFTISLPKPQEDDEDDSSDSDSDEEIPARISPATLAARAQKKPPVISRIITAAETEIEDESEEDDEVRSNSSSARESRSPIVFNHHPQENKVSRPVHRASADLDESSEEDEADEEDEDEDQDEEIPDAPARSQTTPPGKRNNETEFSDGSESAEEEEEDADDREPSQELPQYVRIPTKGSQPNGSSRQTGENHSDKSASTQEELAQQLTSSVYEARQTTVSSSIVYPPTSSIAKPSPRPSIKFGASLSQLNLKKPIVGSPANKNVNGSKPSIKTILAASDEEGEEDEEDEEEEESDESGSSDEEAAKMPPPPKTTLPMTRTIKREPSPDSDSDDSDEADAKNTQRLHAQLAQQIAGMKQNAAQDRGSSAGSISNIRASQASPGKALYGMRGSSNKDR